MTFGTWYIFKNPTLAASDVVQVSLVETLGLAIMGADTTLKTILPIETTMPILRQLFTSLSLDKWEAPSITTITHKTNKCQLSEDPISCLSVSSLLFDTMCSFHLNARRWKGTTIWAGSALIHLLAKRR